MSNEPPENLLFSRVSAILYLLDRTRASRASIVAIDASIVSSSGLSILKIVDNGIPIQLPHLIQTISFALKPLASLGLLHGCLFLTQSHKEIAAIFFDSRLNAHMEADYCAVIFDRREEPEQSDVFYLREGDSNLEALEAITKFSPFKTIWDLVHAIRSYSSVGTQVILYGIPSHFMRTEHEDIVFTKSTPGGEISLRQALSVLYDNSTPRFFLRSTEVRPRRLLQEIRTPHIKYLFDDLPNSLTVDVGIVGPEDVPQGEWFEPRESPFPLFRAVYVYVDGKLSSIGNMPEERAVRDLIAVVRVSSPKLDPTAVPELVLASLEDFSRRVKRPLEPNSTISLSPEMIRALWTVMESSVPTAIPQVAPSPKKPRKSTKSRSVAKSAKKERGQPILSRRILDESESYNCCSRWRDTGFQIQCDKCSLWQHGLCIGFASSEEVPDPYYCDVCLIAAGVDFKGADAEGQALKLRNSRCVEALRKVCQYLLFYASHFEELSEFTFSTEEEWNSWQSAWQSAMERVREPCAVIDLLLDFEAHLADALKIEAWNPRKEGWIRELQAARQASLTLVWTKPPKGRQSAILKDLFALTTELPFYINDSSEVEKKRGKKSSK